jgi:hypothetical protein
MFEWSRTYFQNEDHALRETKATMAALSSYGDFNALTCYPSQTTLRRITGYSVETIRRHIRKNIDAGWVRKVREGNSYKTTNKYEFTFPTPLAHEGSYNLSTPLASEGSYRLPSPVRPTPLADEGSTPLAGDRLTTNTTNQRTTQQSGSNEVQIPDPFGGSGIAVIAPINDPSNQDTPLADEGSSPVTDEGGQDVITSFKRRIAQEGRFDPFRQVHLWSPGEPMPVRDPFGPYYVNAETGEEINA